MFTGVNEYIPQFSSKEYVFTVSESTQLGYLVGEVSATDEDLGPEAEVFYYLVGDSNSKGFSVDANTGTLTVSDEIDRESTAEIMLDILAKNHGPVTGNNTDLCQVRVIVHDANDPPQFTQSLYEVLIPEDISHPKNVIQVSAVDNDLEANVRKFTYQMLDGNSALKFTVDSQTGWVRTAGSLDREAVEVYELIVGAVETGPSGQTGSTTVRVILEDVNDNGPYFWPELPEGHVPENKTPYTTTVIDLRDFTLDPDLSSNQELYEYALLDHTDLFDIGLTSGLVQARVMLDREGDNPEYLVTVKVNDGGDPTMSSTLTFSVIIDDVNDNPSRSRPLVVVVYAYSGVFGGGKIADVKPLDDDIAGDYHCDLESGDIATFTLPQACDLTAGRVQDMKRYTLQIQGSDGVHSVVPYQADVEFRRFGENAVQATVVVMLRDITVASFLDTRYNTFTDSVSGALGSASTAVVYNVEQIDADLAVYIVGEQSDTYLPVDELSQRLQSQKATIEQEASVTITAVDHDPCDDNPCHNDAQCDSQLTLHPEYVTHDSPSLVLTTCNVQLVIDCTCPQGFTGHMCESRVNACEENPCLHDGTCTTSTSDGSFVCHCPPSWTGQTCSDDVDECSGRNPCQNGGHCINTAGSYTCDCADSYSGQHCQVAGGSCSPNPCTSGRCVSQGNTYRCHCDYGDRGEDCEIQSTTYHTDSYTEYALTLDEDQNTVVLEFVVGDTDVAPSLLFYYPVESNTFLAVEIIEGRVVFSFALGHPGVTRLRSRKTVEVGTWYRVEATRDGKVMDDADG